MTDVLKLGFLASHNGSSMRAIVAAAQSGELPAIPCVLISNNADAPALAYARKVGVPAHHLSRSKLGDGTDLDRAIAETLAAAGAEWLILSGYLRKLGPRTLARHAGRILNIHPSLLPKFGGPGMYGLNVHKAVIAAGERVSGATVHLVDEQYDHGPVLARREVAVEPGETPQCLARRIQEIEPALFLDVLHRLAEGSLVLPTGT